MNRSLNLFGRIERDALLPMPGEGQPSLAIVEARPLRIPLAWSPALCAFLEAFRGQFPALARGHPARISGG